MLLLVRMVLILMATTCTVVIAAPVLNPADFADSTEYYSPKLSPTGAYLAVGVGHGSDASLVVLDASTYKPVGGAKFPSPKAVGAFHWVNDERLVIHVVESNAWEHEPKYTGELFAVNYNGEKGRMIYGYSSGRNSSGYRLRQSRPTYGMAKIESFLNQDNDTIIISSTPPSADRKKHATLLQLNVYSGKTQRVNYAPAPAASFIFDSQSRERFALGIDDERNKLFFKYDLNKEQWTPFSDIELGEGFQPLMLDKQGRNLFYLNDAQSDVIGLFGFDLETRKTRAIYVDPKVDITEVLFNREHTGVYALRTDDGYPKYKVFNTEEDEAGVFEALLSVFKNMAVSVVSRTRDGNQWIVFVRSDVYKGSYYLFNKSTLSVNKLFSEQSGNVELLKSNTKPITVKVSDGTLVPGYLTIPNNIEKPVPLVTLVHGGPHGVRDYWTYDPEVQMLAKEGYAVLRINFRGSAGYGKRFNESGYQRWGDLIQQDIIDVTKWVQALPEINGDKTCIMGASFGAYSALQSSILAGEMFDCAVANAGIYDLEMMFQEGDIPSAFWGESYLEAALGLDREKLHRFSPVHHIEKLNVPVLIAHGEKDRRAPFSHAQALREALEKEDKPFEWFVRSTETHGFYDEKNRTDYHEVVKTFLAEHLN